MAKRKASPPDPFDGLRQIILDSGKTGYAIAAESKDAGFTISQSQLSKFMAGCKGGNWSSNISQRRGLSLELAQALAHMLGYEMVFRPIKAEKR